MHASFQLEGDREIGRLIEIIFDIVERVNQCLIDSEIGLVIDKNMETLSFGVVPYFCFAGAFLYLCRADSLRF